MAMLLRLWTWISTRIEDRNVKSTCTRDVSMVEAKPFSCKVGASSELGWMREPSIETALVLTRGYSIRKDPDTTQLEIRSPYMRATLKQVIQSCHGVNINSNGAIPLSGDPRCLFHSRDELYTYASMNQDKNAKEHITFLLQYAAGHK